MTYKLCLKIINKGTYSTKEEMKEKLHILWLNDRLTEEEYNELIELLNSK